MGSKKKAPIKKTKKAVKKPAARRKATKKAVATNKEAMELKKRLELAEKKTKILEEKERRAKLAFEKERKRRREAEELKADSIPEFDTFNETEAVGVESDLDMGFDFSGSDEETPDTSLSSGRDVFKEAEGLIKKGDFPQFGIYKNSVYEGRVNHPFSWDEIKEQYGPGHYKVQAISTNTGKIFKVESRMVGGVKEVQAAKEKEEKQGLLPPPVAGGIDVEAILNYAARMAQLQVQTKKDEERDVRRTETNFQSTLFQTLSSQAQAQNEMNKMILDSITKSISEMGKSQTEMIKMMREESKEEKRERKDELRHLLSSIKNEKPEFGFKEILEMLNSARTEGATQVKEMQELIDSKLSLMGDKEPIDSGEWSDKLLSAAPALLQSFLARPQVPQTFQPTNQMMPMYGNALAGPVSQAAGGVAHTPYTPETQRRSEFQHQTRVTQEQVRANQEAQTAREENVSRGGLGVVREGDADLGFVTDGEDDFTESTQAETDGENSIENKLNTLVLPSIVEKLGSGADPRVSARETLDLLRENGMTKEQILKVYPFDRVIELVAPYIGEEKLPWVEEFYGHIESDAGNVNRGRTSSESLQTL